VVVVDKRSNHNHLHNLVGHHIEVVVIVKDHHIVKEHRIEVAVHIVMEHHILVVVVHKVVITFMVVVVVKEHFSS